MSEIDITLHVEFDGDTYMKEMDNLDHSLRRLYNTSQTGKRLKIGGRKKVGARYIKEFKALMAKEVIKIVIDITQDLIGATGGTTGNTASAWNITMSNSSELYEGMFKGDPNAYATSWATMKRNNTEAVGAGQQHAYGRLSRNSSRLSSCMRSKYTIHITNGAYIEPAIVPIFGGRRMMSIGRPQPYADVVIREGVGKISSSFNPERYAMSKFNDEFAKAIRRVRYELNKRY